jgi:glycosyltransferase involved in cell wall biosynthesis
MGGGEKYSGAIAETLATRHSVEFLTHRMVDLAEVGRHLGLDLSRVQLRVVPDVARHAAVVEATGDYDLFVNASHLDYFVPRAPRNVLVVYFPATTIAQAATVGTYNRVKGVARRLVGQLIGETKRAHLRHLVFGDTARSSDQTRLGRFAVRGFGLLAPPHQNNSILDTYSLIVTISQYTRGWIRRYWGHDSAVVYPPVEATALAPGPKRNQILSVGRFFAGSHNKKHDALIRAFRATNPGPLAGWELHLAGGYSPTDSNAAYLTGIERAVRSNPAIQLHVNCGTTELQQLYAESTFFWHATGVGEDELAHPERFEHFGITTVEAMAAGCVPIVLGKGGQPEIVRSGVDGILWCTEDALVSETVSLARDDERRTRLAAAARRRARYFDQAVFRTRLLDVLAPLEIAVGGY